MEYFSLQQFDMNCVFQIEFRAKLKNYLIASNYRLGSYAGKTTAHKPRFRISKLLTKVETQEEQQEEARA